MLLFRKPKKPGKPLKPLKRDKKQLKARAKFKARRDNPTKCYSLKLIATDSTTVKMAAFAPMPRAMVSNATAVNS
jgi:hypothetical protein